MDSEAAKLLVISAVYGSGDKFADVTYRVNDLLRDPETVFWARPQWLGADPTPGWNKALVIVYEHDGSPYPREAERGCRLAADGPGWLLVLVPFALRRRRRG